MKKTNWNKSTQHILRITLSKLWRIISRDGFSSNDHIQGYYKYEETPYKIHKAYQILHSTYNLCIYSLYYLVYLVCSESVIILYPSLCKVIHLWES